MNLAELSRLDIKDLQKIDLKQVTETLRNRTDILLNVIIAGLALIISLNLFGQSGNKIKLIKLEIKKVEEKISTINAYDNIQNELTQYLAQVPEALNEDQVVTLLTDLAVSRNVQILSVSPSNPTQNNLFTTTSTHLTITADDYKDLWHYIYELERSPHAFRIDAWEGALETPSGPAYGPGSRDSENPLKLQVKMDVSSVRLEKDDQKNE